MWSALVAPPVAPLLQSAALATVGLIGGLVIWRRPRG